MKWPRGSLFLEILSAIYHYIKWMFECSILARVVSFLAMTDFNFCCLYCLTWRINQGHVVTNIQSSFLHQCDCHPLCSLVQLYAWCSASYSALHRTEATSENFIQFQTVLHKVHAADAIFRCPYFNNTANTFEDSVSVFQKHLVPWTFRMLENFICIILNISEAASKCIWYHKKNTLQIFEISQSKGEN